MATIESKLIPVLKQNARLTNGDIADLIGETEKKVADTIAKLEKKGVLLQYSAIVNEALIPGSSEKIQAMIEVKVAPQKRAGFDSVAKRISKYENVVAHYLVSGGYDFLVIVEGENLQQISAFVSEKLASIDHVVSTGTHFIMKTYKEAGVSLDIDPQSDRLLVTP